jgi:hypothetical protein
MTDNKPYVSPPHDAEGNFKYFLLGEVTPVRVTYYEPGLVMCVEAPDPKNLGTLKINNDLLSRLEKSHEVEDITRSKFVELCAQGSLKKNLSSQRPATQRGVAVKPKSPR